MKKEVFDYSIYFYLKAVLVFVLPEVVVVFAVVFVVSFCLSFVAFALKSSLSLCIVVKEERSKGRDEL